MAVKVSVRIRSLRALLSWAEDYTNLSSWRINHTDYTHEMSDLKRELKLVLAICSWAEIKFSLEESSFMDKLYDSLYENENEIHRCLQKVYEDGGYLLEMDNEHCHVVFSTFIDAVDSLQSLILKTLEEYINQQCSKQSLSKEKLLNLIPLVLEDPPIEIIRYRLDFMKGFIRLADSQGVSEYEMRDLFAHGEFMFITAVFYSYLHKKPQVVVDTTTKTVIDNQFSEILIYQPPPKVRETFVREILRSSSFSSSQIRTDDVDIVLSVIDSLVENHMQLLESSSGFIVCAIKIIVEEFRFLKNFLMYKKSSKGGTRGSDDDDHLVRRTTDLVVDEWIYSHSWDAGDYLKLREKLMIRDAKVGFSNWIENVELFKRDVGMKYLEETAKYKFPRTNELGFIDGLLDELKELMIMDDNQVLEDLVFLRDFLEKIISLRHENVSLNALWIQVVEISYRIEFVVNSMVVGDSSPDCSPDSLHAIKEEIKKIKAKVKEIYAEKKFQEMDRLNLKREKVSINLPSRNSNPTMNEVVVGFEDEVKKIIDRIGRTSLKLEIVSIVGMAGQGKTTLAKKVYNEVRSQFHVCSWCCISQGYTKQKWLLDILKGTLEGMSNGDRYDKEDEGDLENYLRQSLIGKRYLIVLDDTWEIETWCGLKICFPDDNNGSRILLTTRMHDVALCAGGESSDNSHFIRSLNDQESWQLMQTKLFPNKEDCSEELQSIGKRVAKSCKGLPFAIVTVAGILGTMEQDKWDDFAKGLINRRNFISHTDVLELSYMHLPDYLKPCLLYLGSFLQDQRISVSRLIWLWIAEGFVVLKKKDGNGKQESLENLAMEHLEDLIKRSLVMAEDEKSRGGIKSCSIHDLVHQFCTEKAKEENFQQQLILPDEIKVPLPEPHRLCIYSTREYFSQVRLSFRHLSSLILFPVGKRDPMLYDISSNFKHFKLLKVMDLRGFICGNFPEELEMLVQLRYLALVGKIKFVPSTTIAKLSKLETFLLKGTIGEIRLPFNLLNNSKELRHLHVNNRVVFDPMERKYLREEVCKLETFCTLLLSEQEQIKYIIQKIKFIQKLKCTFMGSARWAGEELKGYQIPALNILNQLESLKLHSMGKVRYTLEFNFPSNLRKLTLSNFYLPWERISVFAELPNLEVLKLLSKACEGEKWDMGEEQVFSNLQFLKLENLDIVNWNAYSENFPFLRKLVLNKCKKLLGIPMGMGEINTLEVIEVKWCKSSVVTSAQALEEAIEGLKVFIHINKSEENQ